MKSFARFDPDDPTEVQVPGGCPDCVGPSPEPGEGWGHAPWCARAFPAVTIEREGHSFRIQAHLTHYGTIRVICSTGQGALGWHGVQHIDAVTWAKSNAGQMADLLADASDRCIADLLPRLTPSSAVPAWLRDPGAISPHDRGSRDRIPMFGTNVSRWWNDRTSVPKDVVEPAPSDFEANERRMIDDIKARLMTGKADK